MTGAQASTGPLIENYRVEREIAHNGVSCVYLGVPSAPPEQVVAIKVWHALPLSALRQLQFLQEVRLLRMLRHPHLLPILEGGIDGECPYLVTGYAQGGSLRDLLESQPGSPLPLRESLIMLSQVGQALQYAHHFHITHGNLKPENILFTAQGDVLLSDLAISTLQEPVRASLGEAGRTASYLAPEQVQGMTSEASDQFALGCIGYELLTGRLPFAADSREALEHAQERPQPPTLLNMLLPAHLEEAILTALEGDQEARHASVKDFLTALGSPAPLFQPRTLPVPVRPRLALPAPSAQWWLAQPTSYIPPLLLGAKHHGGSDDSPGDAQIQQQSDRAETTQPREEADTAILSPVQRARLNQSRAPERASPSVGILPNAPVGAGTLTRAGISETRRPVSSRSIPGHRSAGRSWWLLWFAAVIFSIVVAGEIISLSRFATLSLFSSKTAVQVSPQAPEWTPPAEPAAAPSPVPSGVPSATPSPPSTPTLQPRPSPSPASTPSPAPAPGLTVTPIQVNAHTDCRVRGHWYTCVITLASPRGNVGSASWSASSSGLPQVTFSPSAGVLSPGQQQQVSVSARSSCPATASLIFSVGSRATTVRWVC